jgi:hypothetical protein
LATFYRNLSKKYYNSIYVAPILRSTRAVASRGGQYCKGRNVQ